MKWEQVKLVSSRVKAIAWVRKDTAGRYWMPHRNKFRLMERRYD